MTSSRVEYLSLADVLEIAAQALKFTPTPRDYGLLQSAVDRPRTSVFGQDAYQDVYEKAAALLHSLASNHALLDGDKRTGWACAIVFLEINGHPLLEPLDEDKAESLVLKAAQGMVDLDEIAVGLRGFILQ